MLLYQKCASARRVKLCPYPDLFAWAALTELRALSLPAAKLVARLGLSPSLARLYADLAGLGPECDR